RPIAEPAERDVLAEELAPLAPVVAQGGFAVYVCTQREAPEVLREIGRLREVTFRAVGEGTGKALDIDRFDPYYRQIVVWNAEAREVVGAYRMFGTDEALARGGVEALYTHTLFEFDRATIEALGPALELGRSFVRREYQKNYAPLMLLWRGIAEWIVANPRYRVLFGAVSITAEYQPLSQALMVHYLRLRSRHEGLARAVHSRNPVDLRDLGSAVLAEGGPTLGDLKELSTLVSEVEPDRKGVPTLLKEYLKLGGRVLDFNVDAEFGDVLDALLIVDLAETPQRVLARYMGADGAARFRAHHGL
ncbi:MAG TPA: GNAT family N-acyltransferase, partial [Planctomycetota bacterium]|nr:GNAT family N-acyltransferase [Planctomycetota bacterium]